ncbi:LexA family protein [Dialister invisus]|jgi:repressor LexA|uniref:LexA family protein n=1 Tax=Dialister invisus TaxID=218538 RepID=UPI003993B678
MTLGDKIKFRREELQMSQEELANRLGYKSRSTIAKIESGENDLTQSKIIAFAKALNTTAQWLLDYDDLNNMPIPPGTHRPKFKKVPMLGYTAAGQPLEDLNQDTSYFDVENKYDVDFCITVRGNSMINAGIKDGDIVFVKSVQDIPNGKIACVEIDNEKICLKRFYRFTDSVMLVSENPANPPLHFNENNCESLKILGLAILKQSEVH